MRKMRKSAAVALTAAMAVTSMGVIPAMADETTTIRVMVWDRGDAPQGMTVEENKMSEWINEQVADLGLQVEFVAVPRSTSEDVLTTMMTGGNAPDIIFSYDQNVFLNYANLGGLADLTDAYENIGTTIQEQSVISRTWVCMMDHSTQSCQREELRIRVIPLTSARISSMRWDLRFRLQSRS